jgi:hypothetical protein
MGMTLEILTPESKLYNGDVYGVQLPALTGLLRCWTDTLRWLLPWAKATLKC